MNENKRVLISVLNDYVFLGKKLGYFKEENMKYVIDKVNSISKIDISSTMNGDMKCIFEKNNIILLVNEHIFKLPEYQRNYLLFKCFSKYIISPINEINDILNQTLGMIDDSIAKKLDYLSNRKAYICGWMLIRDAISLNMAEDLICEKYGIARKNRSNMHCKYAEITFKSNFRETPIFQELAMRFAEKTLKYNENECPLKELCVASYNKRFIQKMIFNRRDYLLFINEMIDLGIIFNGESSYNGNRIKYLENYANAVSIEQSYYRFMQGNELEKGKLK